MIINNKETHGLTWIQIGEEAIRDEHGVIQVIDGKVELDISAKGQLERVFSALSAKRNARIVLDLGLVSYMDSSALWEIYGGYQKIVKAGGKMGLIHLNKDVQRIMDLTKLAKRIPIFNSTEEAIQQLTS